MVSGAHPAAKPPQPISGWIPPVFGAHPAPLGVGLHRWSQSKSLVPVAAAAADDLGRYFPRFSAPTLQQAVSLPLPPPPGPRGAQGR